MGYEILIRKEFKNKAGKSYFNFKILLTIKGFGINVWISELDFDEFPDYLKIEQGLKKSESKINENLDSTGKLVDTIILKEPIEDFYRIENKENKNGKFKVLLPKSKIDYSINQVGEPEVIYNISNIKSGVTFLEESELNKQPDVKMLKLPKLNFVSYKTDKTTNKIPKKTELPLNKNEKIAFINSLLDYSVKKKIDNETRKRLFGLIGREVENSGELKEVVARIEKLENAVKPINQGDTEEKFELDLSNHQPMNLVNFIDKFRDSNGIKYLTHKFEIPGQIFNREEIIEIAKKEFWDFVMIKPIYSLFYNCFRVFAFGGYDYKNHKGEIVKKTEWSFNRTKYSLNWKSPKIDIWCSENPGMHPIEKFDDEFIKPFQLTYKVENGILKEYLIDRLATALGNSYSNFDIEIIDCEKANFKTDVDSLLSGISGILNSIKQREIQSRKIKIVFERKGRTRFIKVVHIGSNSNKSFEEEEHDLLQGDLLNVKRNLFCVCDWSILSENPSSKINQINILYDIKNKKAKEFINEPIEGFTHILTFYS